MNDTKNIKGLKELSKKLDKLTAQVGLKVLGQATKDAVKSTVKEMKAHAPVGDKAHKTYKGRIVPPGFLRSAINAKLVKKKGRATTWIGVKDEAFYGVQFLDRGITVKERRVKRTSSDKTEFVRGKKLKRKSTTVKPYHIRGHKFFKFVFLRNQDKMADNVPKYLAKRIDKAIGK